MGDVLAGRGAFANARALDLEAAASAAISDGWAIVPVVGKRPPRGFTRPAARAVRELEDARTLLGAHPDSTGVAGILGDRYVALDLDPRAWTAASRLWLRAHAGPVAHATSLPATRMHWTGGGGVHLVYRAPAGRAVRNRELAPGVELRGSGLLVLPGSLHASGRAYHVEDDVPPVELPAWLVEDDVPRPVRDRERLVHVQVHDQVPVGRRHRTLQRAAGRLRARGHGRAGIRAGLAAVVVQCEQPTGDTIAGAWLDGLAASYATLPPGGTPAGRLRRALEAVAETFTGTTATTDRTVLLRGVLPLIVQAMRATPGLDPAVTPVPVAVRSAMLAAGFRSTGTVCRALRRLVAAGVLAVHPDPDPLKSSRFTVIVPRENTSCSTPPSLRSDVFFRGTRSDWRAFRALFGRGKGRAGHRAGDVFSALSENTRTASSIAQGAGIPRRSVFRALARLRGLGLACPVPGGGWVRGVRGLEAVAAQTGALARAEHLAARVRDARELWRDPVLRKHRAALRDGRRAREAGENVYTLRPRPPSPPFETFTVADLAPSWSSSWSSASFDVAAAFVTTSGS